MTDEPKAVHRAEFLSPRDRGSLQRDRWLRQSAYVAASSAFYRSLWDGRPVDPRLDALEVLPFTDKEMLRSDQAAHPPFGRYLAAEPAQIGRVHRTSGSTGLAMNLALSAGDATLTAVVAGRAQSAAGLRPGHRVVHCLNYQLWMGGLSDHLGLEATGAAVVPFGVGSTDRLIDTILELGIDAISCTPSYPAVIEQVLSETRPALRPRDLGLRLGLFGGEAGLDDTAFRARLEATWGFAVRNANYGVSDVLCNFAGQCDRSNDLHFVAPDVLFPELVAPGGDRLLPWREGASGELVLTHLAKDCQPLVRFRSGDIVTITGTETCACGRSATRFRVVGRADDMVVVRGINVFPTMVAALVNRQPELSGEYRIILRGGGPYDHLPLEAELAPPADPGSGLAADRAKVLAQALAADIKRQLGVSAEITVLPPRSLPRTAGKTKRVIRAAVPDETVPGERTQ